MDFSCRICGNAENNRIHRAREMMFGMRDPFDYLECGACGTIQICEIPADLSRYYPEKYYSFKKTKEEFPTSLKKRFVARLTANYLGNRRNLLGKHFLNTRHWIQERVPPWLLPVNLRINVHSKILDFGSGMGEKLLQMRYFGFRNLTGVDAFVESDIFYPSGVRILKKELKDLKPSFDFIMLHHSFEHLANPKETLSEIFRLLRRGKYALVRIPVAAFAWEKYGVDWVQLDAPRHLFLYTEKSFRALAEEAGFRVEKVVYDSESFQFWASEQYRRDIPLHDERAYKGNIEESIFTAEQLAEWERQTGILNAEKRGDQACFYLRKP